MTARVKARSRRRVWSVFVVLAVAGAAVVLGPHLHPPGSSDSDDTKTVLLRVQTRNLGAKTFHENIRYQPTRLGLVSWTVAGHFDSYHALPWQQTFERVPVGSRVRLAATPYATEDPKDRTKNLPPVEFDCEIFINGHRANPENQPSEVTCSQEALVM
jgi:hypothetical protein